MNKVRERVKFNVPAVVLTLLGIVQAFALELLWTFVAAEDALVTFNLEGLFFSGSSRCRSFWRFWGSGWCMPVQ